MLQSERRRVLVRFRPPPPDSGGYNRIPADYVRFEFEGSRGFSSVAPPNQPSRDVSNRAESNCASGGSVTHALSTSAGMLFTCNSWERGGSKWYPNNANLINEALARIYGASPRVGDVKSDYPKTGGPNINPLAPPVVALRLFRDATGCVITFWDRTRILSPTVSTEVPPPCRCAAGLGWRQRRRYRRVCSRLRANPCPSRAAYVLAECRRGL